MKNYGRAPRLWKSKCKLERRLKVWVVQGGSYPFCGDYSYEVNKNRIGGCQIEDVKNDVRSGKYWNFLKWTSTPCSCRMCSGPKYKRDAKHRVNKQMYGDIYVNF